MPVTALVPFQRDPVPKVSSVDEQAPERSGQFCLLHRCRRLAGSVHRGGLLAAEQMETGRGVFVGNLHVAGSRHPGSPGETNPKSPSPNRRELTGEVGPPKVWKVPVLFVWKCLTPCGSLPSLLSMTVFGFLCMSACTVQLCNLKCLSKMCGAYRSIHSCLLNTGNPWTGELLRILEEKSSPFTSSHSLLPPEFNSSTSFLEQNHSRGLGRLTLPDFRRGIESVGVGASSLCLWTSTL